MTLLAGVFCSYAVHSCNKTATVFKLLFPIFLITLLFKCFVSKNVKPLFNTTCKQTVQFHLNKICFYHFLLALLYLLLYFFIQMFLFFKFYEYYFYRLLLTKLFSCIVVFIAFLSVLFMLI